MLNNFKIGQEIIANKSSFNNGFDYIKDNIYKIVKIDKYYEITLFGNFIGTRSKSIYNFQDAYVEYNDIIKDFNSIEINITELLLRK